jgi:histone H2B
MQHCGASWRKFAIGTVLKQVQPKLSLDKGSEQVLNDMLIDVALRVFVELTNLSELTHHRTVDSRNVQAAVRLVLNGELRSHAISEGTKAVTKVNKIT